MSQVRKLKTGGNEPKTYTILFDGQNVNLTEDQLSEINNQIANLDMRLKQHVGNVSNAIQSGTFIGNRAENEMSLSALTNISEKDRKFLQKGKKTYWEAITDGPTYRTKEAIDAVLRIIGNVVNSSSTKKDTKSKLTKIGTDEIVLDFNTDENGNLYLSPYANVNLNAKNRVSQILEHLKAGNASTYDASDWDLSGISRWIEDRNSEDNYKAASEYFADLWKKMGKDGGGYTIDPDTEDLLANFGIKTKSGNSSDSDNTARIKAQLAADFKNNPDLYEYIGDAFEKDKNGVWRLKADYTFNPGIELKPGQGIFFNDDYFKQFPTANQNALRNLTFIGNALYNLNDPKLAEILESTDYNKYMRSGNFDAADDIIRSRFTKTELENPGTVGPEQYSVYFGSNPRHRFINVTGLVDVLDPTRITAGDQIVKEIDLDNPDVNEGNPYVHYTYKYRILDRFGNDKGEIDSKYIREKPDGQKTKFKAYSRITGAGDSKYEGMYYIDDTDANGDEIPIRFYYDPKDDSKVILHLPNISANGVDGGDLLLPPQIATILKNNTDLINVLVRNPNLLSNFRKMMSKLVQSKTRAFDIDFINMRNQFEKMNFSKEQAKALAKGIRDYVGSKKSNRFDRRDQSIVYKPLINKMGGKVNYIKKLATGGVSGGSTETESAKLKRDVILKNPASAKAIGDGTKPREADIADIVALVADAVSMGTTFADPTNLVGAATGAVGSLSRFRADMLRKAEDPNGSEGKGAGWNLLLNLGMDAASLIPVAGDAVQAAKFAKNLRKALPAVLRFISYAGLGDAVYTAANKIANDEKWTVRDLSILVNGLTAGVNAYRLGGFGRSTKTVKTKSVPEKVKIGNDERDLPNAAIERILNKPASKQREQTIAELKEIFGDSVDSRTLEKEADNLLRSRRSLWQRITRKDGDMVLNTKKGTKDESIEAETDFGKWWRRQNDDINAYTKRIAGEVPQEKVTTKVERKGVAKVRKDVAEANGTTPNAEYYQDEFGTWYRKGKTNEQAITEKQYARMKPGRTAINDKNGNFTGKVRVVEEVKPFGVDANGTPIFTETVENYVNKKIPWNIVAPHFLMPFHTHTDVKYSPQYNKNGGILKKQPGGTVGSKIHTVPVSLDTIKTIIKRIRNVGNDELEGKEIVLDGNVPDDVLIQMYKLHPEQLIQDSEGNLTGIYGSDLTQEPFTVTRETVPVEPEKPSGLYKPIYGPEGKIIGWKAPTAKASAQEAPSNPVEEPIQEQEPISEEPTESTIEVPTESTNDTTNSHDKNVILVYKPNKETGLSDSKYNFITKNFGIKSPTITDIRNLNIPVTKQKVAKFKTKNKEDVSDLIEVLKQIYEDKANDTVIKGQSGIPGIDPNWKPNVGNDLYIPQNKYPKYPELPDWTNPTLDTSKNPWAFRSIDVKGVLGMQDFHSPSYVEKNFGSANNVEKEQDVKTAKGSNYNLPNISKWLLPGLSAFRYFDTLRNQRKYRDTDKARINAARYNETPVQANLARTDNPVLDRALRQINEERMSGIKPITSDVVVNNALKQQRDAQLLTRERDIINALSESYQQKELENLNISNQNLANQTLTANQNRARTASINSALYNPDLEYLLRRDASNQAATLEMQNNIKRDNATMLSLARMQHNTKLTKDYNNTIDTLFPGARAAYNQLNATEAAKYYDFEDYLKQTRPDEWAKNKAEIEKAQSDMALGARQWEADNALSGYTPRWIYGKTSTVGVDRAKKGGRINGNTRYTLEPDERIWIDNNKAAHSQIAKLSDATIKLLLKALK